MKRIALAPAAAIILALLAPASFANPATSPDAPATTATADAPAPLITSSITGPESADKKMADCMAIWEPRTHMTKEQWRRTCKTTLEELPTP